MRNEESRVKGEGVFGGEIGVKDWRVGNGVVGEDRPDNDNVTPKTSSFTNKQNQ